MKMNEKEANLLRALLHHAGHIITRGELLREAWGLDPHGTTEDTRIVHISVSRLRKIVGAEMIMTVKGAGYMWVGPVDFPVPDPTTLETKTDKSAGRIGTRRGKGLGVRRQPVWYLVCPMCGREADVNAYLKRSDPDANMPQPMCEGTVEQSHGITLMENKGLYLMWQNADGSKHREEAVALRKEYELARMRRLRSKPMCACGHEWWHHKVFEGRATYCTVCVNTGGNCFQFTPAIITHHVKELGPDNDVPF